LTQSDISPAPERLVAKADGRSGALSGFKFVFADAILYPGKPERSIACCTNPDASQRRVREQCREE